MLRQHGLILPVAEGFAGIDQDLRIGHDSGADEPRPDQLRRRENEKRGHDDRADDAS
jgi:hypothetical protein